MKEIILFEEEINVLKDLQNNMDKNTILLDLKNYWFIDATFTGDIWCVLFTGDIWCVFSQLNVNWKQVLRQIEGKSILDNFEFELDLWLIKIKKK